VNVSLQEIPSTRVEIEAIFPDLVRFRLPAWSEDAVLYVERKRLPREVDIHLLEAGYRFAVEADLDALTPADLVASFRNWTAEPAKRQRGKALSLASTAVGLGEALRAAYVAHSLASVPRRRPV
jgi:hypothetical protein